MGYEWIKKSPALDGSSRPGIQKTEWLDIDLKLWLWLLVQRRP